MTIASSTTPASSVSTSHDYARCLQQAAEFLLSRPAFDLDTQNTYSFSYFRYYAKEPFIAAVKAIGSGKKCGDEKDIEFNAKPMKGVEILISAPRNTVCRLVKPAEYESAPRNTVCRLVKPAEYECDPLLSPDEEQSLGGAS